jgi:hypothetical protein
LELYALDTYEEQGQDLSLACDQIFVEKAKKEAKKPAEVCLSYSSL